MFDSSDYLDVQTIAKIIRVDFPTAIYDGHRLVRYKMFGYSPTGVHRFTIIFNNIKTNIDVIKFTQLNIHTKCNMSVKEHLEYVLLKTKLEVLEI